MLSLLTKILEVEFKAIAELDQRIIRWDSINRIRRLTVKLVSDSNLDLDLVDLVTLCSKFMEEFNADGCYLGLIELLQKMGFPPDLIEQLVNYMDEYAQMKQDDENIEDITIGHYILDANQLDLISLATILGEMPIVVYELLHIVIVSVESKILTPAGRQEFKVRQKILDGLLDRLSEETGFKYSRVYYRAPPYPKYKLVKLTLTSYFDSDERCLREDYRELLNSQFKVRDVDFSLDEGRLRITFEQEYGRDLINPLWEQLFVDPRRKYFD